MYRIKSPGNSIIKDVESVEEVLKHIETIIDTKVIDMKETAKLLSSGWQLGFNGFHYQQIKSTDVVQIEDDEKIVKPKKGKSAKSLSEDLKEVQKSIKISHKKTEEELEKIKKVKKKTK